MHEAPIDIAACLDRIGRGDEDAARDLVAALHPLVMTIVRAHLPVRLAEEDLAQEIYARVFDRLGQYEPRPGVPFQHWVARLAVRTCLDAARFERRRPELRSVDLAEGEEEWLEFLAATEAEPPAADAVDARELVHRLLAQLEPPDRLVISLLDLEGKSAAEASALTGWSVVGVRVRAFRARRRLHRLAAALREEFSR